MDLKNKISTFEQEHEDILALSEKLDTDITNLRYEGKVNFSKNIHSVEKTLTAFCEKLIPHMKLEDVVFAYLDTHVPKLDPVIRLLQAEHKELHLGLEMLQFLRREIAEEKNETKRTQAVERLRDKGTYVIYFLRNHMQAEKESIYAVIQKDLKKEEQKELQRRIVDSQETGSE